MIDPRAQLPLESRQAIGAAGMAHGSQVSVDLLAAIDPWDHFADPLEQVRHRFNVWPRGREPEWPATIMG